MTHRLDALFEDLKKAADDLRQAAANLARSTRAADPVPFDYFKRITKAASALADSDESFAVAAFALATEMEHVAGNRHRRRLVRRCGDRSALRRARRREHTPGLGEEVANQVAALRELANNASCDAAALRRIAGRGA